MSLDAADIYFDHKLRQAERAHRPTRTTTRKAKPVTTALIIRRDKTVAEVDLPADPSDRLAFFQGVVDGWIEPVNLDTGDTMYVNEERYNFAPEDFNSIASDVCGPLGRPDLMFSGILGDVVVAGPLTAGDHVDPPTARVQSVIGKVMREAGGEMVTA